MWRRKQRDDDLQRELRSDLELEAAEQQENGLSEEQARYAAQRAFGNTTPVKEEVREMWHWSAFETIWQDLRFSSETRPKTPETQKLSDLINTTGRPLWSTRHPQLTSSATVLRSIHTPCSR